MKLITLLYTLLLVYIIAALVFWGISLHKQNRTIYQYEITALNEHTDSITQPIQYKKQYNDIQYRKQSRDRQFLGEGATFLIVILIGAVVVYSSIRSNDKLAKQQSNFMLSVTHELKSPVAAIKLNLQTLARRRLEEDTQLQLIERCINESNRLDDLCNNLLLASRMESKHFNPSMETLILAELVTESIHTFEQRCKHRIISDLDYNCTINGDRLLWKMVINNLLENAIKYSLPGTQININIEKQDENVILSFADQGGGIPDNEKPKIFKKFYRIGHEGERKTKGTGLGLFLTARIVEQHKSSITVRDNTPLGTIFEITIPISSTT